MIKIHVVSNKKFSRDGLDLSTEVFIPLSDCILGCKTRVDTLDKSVDLKIPPRTQNGQKIKLPGLGMSKVGDFSKRGDFYAVIRPLLPMKLSVEEEQFYKNTRDSYSDERIDNE